MTFRRWAATTALMGGAAWALWLVGPGLLEVRDALTDPQGLVDRSGPDALVLVCVPLLAWLCWAWGALGLLLTAAATVPGWAGRLAGVLLTGVLPAGARPVAAVALGVGLSTAAPVLLAPVALPAVTASAAASEHLGADPDAVVVDRPAGTAPVPDWPGAPPAVPDWPGVGPEEHVVLRGDCLWDIAAGWLERRQPGVEVTDTAVREATQAWWRANAAVIGADPDLLLPGQVLRPPG
ncbi:conserved membrane protein of unknown function [Modestobacter italicus]|uniref:LysM domain-containing protein n=1 Tax=Modestobacter italicus (strain DSM 44449 / CECT 9708 / BC 501) TaxID=2732864 RepID=I4F346_MODI5|nr:hypothetical protein [Modestobacter marinus]CCH90059.1 conserved membrane protein of unknown function [Modestobacter marinus]